jgi:hypothetical protein
LRQGFSSLILQNTKEDLISDHEASTLCHVAFVSLVDFCLFPFHRAPVGLLLPVNGLKSGQILQFGLVSSLMLPHCVRAGQDLHWSTTLQSITGFGKQIVRGVFGTDFRSYVMTF